LISGSDIVIFNELTLAQKITPNNLLKGKAKLISQQTDKISQQLENWENRNGPDLVQNKQIFEFWFKL
jgi:hypothetical protein